MVVLGIESSCDDTSVCLLEGEKNNSSPPRILSLQHFSQEDLLKRWGGVIPEIAARNHCAKLPPLLSRAFEEAAISLDSLDAIGVTTEPGLLGPLLTGLNAAKTLSSLARLPLIPVNHLQAHLEAIHLGQAVDYPYLGLVVSGGHTLFLTTHSATRFELVGTTLDDAAGEAFDKGGKLLKLGYPAGKVIDQLAREGHIQRELFPIGLADKKNAYFSYSGVKTALRNFLKRHPPETLSPGDLRNICASYQHAIVEAIVLKTRFALKAAPPPPLPIVVGGGVACNSYLRERMREEYPQVLFVEPRFCTDNGAMIANHALRTHGKNAVPWPDCLKIDANDRFIDKARLLAKNRQKRR